MEWPETLIDDLARRRTVLFLGAGVSRNSVGADGRTRPPLWFDFLNTCVRRSTSPKKYVRGIIAKGDYLTAAEILKTNLADEWLRIITDSFVTPRFRHASIHESIFKLDARVCLTQNIDKIYDTYAQNESKNTILVKRHFDDDVANAIRGDSRCIIKAHGTIDQPTKMIFTRGEYARARYEHAPFYAILDALALTHTFLFVGAGFSDPDVQLMLERMAQLYPNARPHYMLVSGGQVHREHAESIRRTMNLKIIEYKYSKTHHHLGLMLSDLVDHVEERRGTLADSRDW